MDTLFTFVCSLTFLLSVVISSLLMLLMWIAFPEIARYKAWAGAVVIVMSVVLTIHYSKQEYNPDKRYYKSLADKIHEQNIQSPGRQ